MPKWDQRADGARKTLNVSTTGFTGSKPSTSFVLGVFGYVAGKFFPTRIRGQQKAGAFDIGLARDAESPQELNPQVPAVLSSLVMDCCCNGAANRPTMSQVLDRFRAVSHALKIVRE